MTVKFLRETNVMDDLVFVVVLRRVICANAVEKECQWHEKVVTRESRIKKVEGIPKVLGTATTPAPAQKGLSYLGIACR